MGCVVNGPARPGARISALPEVRICAMLFVRGQQVRMLRGNIVDELCEEIRTVGVGIMKPICSSGRSLADAAFMDSYGSAIVERCRCGQAK